MGIEKVDTLYGYREVVKQYGYREIGQTVWV